MVAVKHPRRPPWLTKRRVRVAVRWLAVVTGLGLGGLALLVVYGVALIDGAFRSGQGTASTIVVSAPLRLVRGDPWTAAALRDALARRGIRGSTAEPPRAGEAFLGGPSIVLERSLLEENVEVVLRPSDAGLALATRDGRLLAAATVRPMILGTTAPEGVVRWPVQLDRMSPILLTAVVDIEDRGFLSHAGLSFRGLLRAAWSDVLAGGARQGGSTITQQLAKNLLLKPARTLPRKILEAWLAGLIEYRYDKRTILEVYLNRIYLGQDGGWQILGVGAGAHYYFGKPVHALELDEAALLAGLIAAPNRFDPFTHRQVALGRRNAVLAAMVRSGHLSADLEERIARLPLPEAPRRLRWQPAAHALDVLLAAAVPQGELRTCLDPDVQAAVTAACETAIPDLEKRHLRLRELVALGDPIQVAAVVLAPSGRILGLQGSRTGGPGELDRALAARRSVGSLVKPFTVATAILHGWSPDDPLEDEPISMPVGSEVWEPKNNDGTFRGTTSVREALVLSLNVPMVSLGLAVGLDKVAGTLRTVGFEVAQPTPAALLGAFPATPMQVARAFAVFGNGGSLPQPTLQEDAVVSPVPVLDPGVVGKVLTLLEEVPVRGTAAALAGRVEGRLACKTGTTDGRRDSWFAAVRPRCVVVVWVGSDGNRETGLYGATGALEVFKAIDARLPAVWKQDEQ